MNETKYNQVNMNENMCIWCKLLLSSKSRYKMNIDQLQTTFTMVGLQLHIYAKPLNDHRTIYNNITTQMRLYQVGGTPQPQPYLLGFISDSGS